MANGDQRPERRPPPPTGRDDAFWLTDLYPDAGQLFSHAPAAVEEIARESFVALDANVLLWPYELNSASLAEIDRVYGELQKASRLVVPGQAAREFYSHRARKLAALSEQLEGAITRARKNPIQNSIPLLEDDSDFRSAQKIAKELLKSGKSMIDKLESVKARIQTDVGNDPVSVVYRKHLANAVFELQNMDKDGIVSEVDRRARLRIAPGFKDQSKDDGGIGDYIIWLTILEQAAARKTHCLFVTNEEKSDWWVKSGGAFQPRPELLDEYRRASGGKSLHLLPLSEMLSLFAAKQDVVDGVQALEEESRQRTRWTRMAKDTFAFNVNSDKLSAKKVADVRANLEAQRVELATHLGRISSTIDEAEAAISSNMSDAAKNELRAIRSQAIAEKKIVLERLSSNANLTLLVAGPSESDVFPQFRMPLLKRDATDDDSVIEK